MHSDCFFNNNPMVLNGIDLLAGSGFKTLSGKNVGLIVNPASVDKNLKYTAEIFRSATNFNLIALFGPQHGIYCTTQDNMIEWEDTVDSSSKTPIYSLYGTHRKPADYMLEGIDTLVIDLPDVGSRYYTFIWTAKLCLEACSEKGIKVIILDRPNPIDGVHVEGPALNLEYKSFVGLSNIAVRHGMTFGELLNMINIEEKIGCNLEIIKMQGWKRDMLFCDTGLPWVLPSPNMPTLETAIVYPGGCLLEATNISEGRGTTRPFELCGAPFINPEEIIRELNSYDIPGAYLRPAYFEPTFNKHKGEICGGFQIHVTDPDKFESVRFTAAFLIAIRKLYDRKLIWKSPPYEYEYEKLPIDILWGDPSLREAVDSGRGKSALDMICEKIKADSLEFLKRREEFLLY